MEVLTDIDDGRARGGAAPRQRRRSSASTTSPSSGGPFPLHRLRAAGLDHAVRRARRVAARGRRRRHALAAGVRRVVGRGGTIRWLSVRRRSLETQGPRLPPGHPVRSIHVIRFEKVTKTYPGTGRPALDQVSIDIEKGEFVFLVGPVRLRQVDRPAAGAPGDPLDVRPGARGRQGPQPAAPAGRCRGCAARSAPSSRTSGCCRTRPCRRTSRSRCR